MATAAPFMMIKRIIDNLQYLILFFDLFIFYILEIGENLKFVRTLPKNIRLSKYIILLNFVLFLAAI